MLHGPLKLRYGCPLPSIWVQSLESLLLVLEVAIPYILKKGKRHTGPHNSEMMMMMMMVLNTQLTAAGGKAKQKSFWLSWTNIYIFHLY